MESFPPASGIGRGGAGWVKPFDDLKNIIRRCSMAERVWDKFLTEQDKATLVGKAERRVGFGERPALLLIDLYRWVFGDKPEPVTEAIKTWPGSCGLAGWNALPHIQKLIAKAREVGIPVIHVTGLDGVAVEPWSFRRDGRKRANMTNEELDRFRRRFDIVDEGKPIPGENVLRKKSPSAFLGTPLIGHLNFLGFDMNQKYADVLPLDEILKYLDAWRAEKAGHVGYANDSIAYLKDLGIGEEYKGLR